MNQNNAKQTFPRIKWLKGVWGLVALCSWLSGCVAPIVQKPQRWAAYYGESANWEQFANLDLVVFDSDMHPPIAPLQERGVKVLAYLSVAEIAPYRDFADAILQLPDFIIGHHERWNASIIDIRNPVWQKHLLEVQIPAIIAQGFDGVMIDTLDSAFAEYSKNPIILSGTQDAAIDLIHQIRQNLPKGSTIMVNRGFEIAPEFIQDVDIILAESILVDGRHQNLQFFEDFVYQQHVDKLQHLRQKNAHLSIFTLDYLSINDMNARQNIECAQRRNGFSPYVAELDLQRYTPDAMTHCEYGRP